MKSFRLFFIVMALAAFMGSCDYVDDPYIIPGPNGCDVAEPDFTPNQNPPRKVLIEDFTGHRCGNCPRAAEEIAAIEAANPGRVISIGVHSSIPSDFTATLPNDISINPQLKYVYDFTREVSTAIDTKFGVSSSGLPIGMINRKVYGTSRNLTYSVWSSKVNEILANPIADIDLQIKNFWNAQDSTLCSYFYARFLNNMSGTFKLAAYLIEDEFVTWQKDYSATPGDIPDYVHSHILRQPITSNWGVLLSDSTVSSNQSFINGYSIKINPEQYVPSHCYVVAFVYDETNWEVIQVEKLKVVQ